MKSSIRKIVVAIDFGDEAEDILHMAGELGRALSAEIHLVHIYQPDPCSPYEMMLYPVLIPQETVAGHEAILRDERRQLRNQAADLREKEVVTFAYMKPLEGTIPHSILEFVSDLHGDLILIGTSRPNRLNEMIVGSVAKKVLKESVVPVLLIPRRIGKG